VIEQFIRGTHDEQLLDKLQIEEKMKTMNIPDYSDFLLEVRTTEAKRNEKRLRVKSSVELKATGMESQYKALENELKAVKAELEKLKSSAEKGSTRKAKDHEKSQKPVQKPWQFCYLCGEDDHMRDKCQNPKNPSLVQEKLVARVEKKSLNSKRSQEMSHQ
jgi:hypothetical protein